MLALPQVAMSFVRLLYEFWLDHGVQQKALDDILDIDINTDAGDKFGISSHKVAKLHQAAVEQIQDPALGIRLGQSLALSDVPIGYVLMKSENLFDGLAALMANSFMVSESGSFQLTNSCENYVRLSFIPTEGVVFSGYQKDMVFSMIESWIISMHPEADGHIKYFALGAIANLAEYKKLLQSPVYEAKDTYLEISNSLLARENLNADQEVYEQYLAQAEKVIAKRTQHLELYNAVRSAIKECLLERIATQENVAGRLSLSIRNLQRRLKDAGTTYQAILDDTREALALKLIKDLDTPLYEISYLVGFTEPSAFYKAFRRWTGRRPGDYRQDIIRLADRQEADASAG